ncbi:MAG: outer membrane protein transport protein [Castellaniella sp.]|uniref:OmpP1/FadL family transporter n=1 Tax=Castellaniella sp. TaxID=1955812 RepID=UPI002A35D44B|nr:porin [Castellaniella sp.]MDY0310332.1 outer membrane protein transport protein [Castellaniella sp.]
MKTQYTLKTLSALILGLGAAGIAHGAGFQLLEQNASGLGTSYAGSAAIAEDASTVFFNPAGMTLLPGMNASAGAVAIKPNFKFSNDGSTRPTHFGGNALGPLGGGASGGSDGDDAGTWAAVPNAYFTWQVNPRIWLGLGLSVPFGLMTDYEEGWAGRYHSEKFSIESINVNPSIAFKATDTLSIGAGVSYMHLDADYRKAQYAAIMHPIAGPLTGDLEARVKAKGDGWGWNVGLLWQATPETRFGLSYRSKVKIDADGTTKIRNRSLPGAAAGALAGMGVIGTHDAETTVELPDTAVLSVVHQLNDRWTLLGDVSWTGWSSIPELKIENTGVPDAELDLRFKDSWRVALGAHYKYSDSWTFKGGVAWDQSPVRDDAFRPASLPDNDRYWVSLGAQYRFNKNTKVDFGYAHMFVKKTSVNNTSDPEGAGVLRGDYDSRGNILGVQLSHQF